MAAPETWLMTQPVRLTQDSHDHEGSRSPPPKRVRTCRDPQSFFRHICLAGLTPVTLADVISSFMEECPVVTRTILSDVKEDETVQDGFVVLQVIRCRGKCTYLTDIRWRLETREILPDGTRDQRHFLTMNKFLPSMDAGMPLELNTFLDYRNPTTAPLIVMTGFLKRRQGFLDREWASNLLCSVETVPRVFVGTVTRPTVASFWPSPNIPPNGLVPGVPHPTNHTRNPGDNGTKLYDSITANHAYGFPAHIPYSTLRNVRVGSRQHVMGVIQFFYPIKPVKAGQEFMQSVGLIDPSLDLKKNEKLRCSLFALSKDRLLPEIARVGDVLVIRNLHARYHNFELLGVGYQNAVKFALVPRNLEDIDAARKASTYTLTEDEKQYIVTLRNWYAAVEPIIMQHEKEYVEKHALVVAGQNATAVNGDAPIIAVPEQRDIIQDLAESILIPLNRVPLLARKDVLPDVAPSIRPLPPMPPGSVVLDPDSPILLPVQPASTAVLPAVKRSEENPRPFDWKAFCRLT